MTVLHQSPFQNRSRQITGEIAHVEQSMVDFKAWIIAIHQKEGNAERIKARLAEASQFLSLDAAWQHSDREQLLRLLFQYYFECESIWHNQVPPNLKDLAIAIIQEAKPLVNQKHRSFYDKIELIRADNYSYNQLITWHGIWKDEYAPIKTQWNNSPEGSWESLELARKGHPLDALTTFCESLLNARKISSAHAISARTILALTESVNDAYLCEITYQHALPKLEFPDWETDSKYRKVFKAEQDRINQKLWGHYKSILPHLYQGF